ncbi:probable UDP-3-O-acylglucosamine N-acyltransferase 2, mitochondrial isoform X2 [Arachis ipaensis]|uniref:probable UDP-3-O-acylglucosamine N-acyltransferase 2, mitochondrial isoform X2 n=1 Tax=Arachis ipaensis TaxID=130454 RepID=UPI000A2B19D1|nr:probable UDP-3-O-acylglucosamine N-acyltransferase 2, mitochondrial isoform X2 [Arachis ipaensis]XP_025629515.1 probable UDP-3-O-acylglucosamine N-acyltransferase 2, mitochondrial isoform X2 [Arachis hypogaea]
MATRRVLVFASRSAFARRFSLVPASDSGCGFQKWQNGGGIFHESASIDSTAVVEVGAVVHSESVIGANVHIGSGTVVGPSVSIAHSTIIGCRFQCKQHKFDQCSGLAYCMQRLKCMLMFNVALSNCCIGDICVIHSGVCIGQDGFGFYVDGDGNMIKKPQKLNVVIGNQVEIGANTCIDRGSWRDTVIGDNSKIDNLVQLLGGIVCFVGKLGLQVQQLYNIVYLIGVFSIGDYVTMGGRVAVRDHVSIVSKVRLAATSCVTKDIKEPGDYGGFPAVPVHKWRRQVARSSRHR